MSHVVIAHYAPVNLVVIRELKPTALVSSSLLSASKNPRSVAPAQHFVWPAAKIKHFAYHFTTANSPIMIFRKLALVACKLNTTVVVILSIIFIVLFVMELNEGKRIETANTLWRQHDASMDSSRECLDPSSPTITEFWQCYDPLLDWSNKRVIFVVFCWQRFWQSRCVLFAPVEAHSCDNGRQLSYY